MYEYKHSPYYGHFPLAFQILFSHKGIHHYKQQKVYIDSEDDLTYASRQDSQKVEV